MNAKHRAEPAVDATPDSAPADEGEMYVPGTFLTAYVAAAKRVDLEPYRQLRAARLPIHGLDAEELMVRQDRFIELLLASSRLAQRPDFILCVLKELSLGSFGPIGLLASAQNTLREALSVLCRFSGNPHRKMRAVLEERGSTAIVRLTFKQPGDRWSAESAMMALGVALRAVQGLVGESWRPVATAFTGPAPADVAPFRAMFGEVQFGAAMNTMTLDPADLGRALTTANPGLARLVGHYLNAVSSKGPPTFEAQVRELIAALLPRGLCAIERVAQHLGVDRRTVHRRLTDQGLSFTGLVHEARLDAVQAELNDRSRPIATLATSLGFSCNSTFSRWFRQTYGVSASQFRKAA